MRQKLHETIQESITKFIYQQTGSDVNRFRTKASSRFEKKNNVMLDLNEVPAVVLNQLHRMPQNFERSLQFEFVGRWILQISWKKQS